MVFHWRILVQMSLCSGMEALVLVDWLEKHLQSVPLKSVMGSMLSKCDFHDMSGLRPMATEVWTSSNVSDGSFVDLIVGRSSSLLRSTDILGSVGPLQVAYARRRAGVSLGACHVSADSAETQLFHWSVLSTTCLWGIASPLGSGRSHPSSYAPDFLNAFGRG